jgi:hypothetical protein
MRRKKYSKGAYKMLKQFWILLGVSGDLMGFTGQLFDREYLNPKSDKYYRYVSILTFMLKYQRLSKKHTKLWFKDVKDHDKDDYFFDNWQQIVSTDILAVADEMKSDCKHNFSVIFVILLILNFDLVSFTGQFASAPNSQAMLPTF